MAASINTIHVNDYVQIDGKEKGRVKPMYNIRTVDGEMRQVSSYRLRKLDHVFVGPDKSDIDLPDDVLEELCRHDFFDEPSNEPLKTYNHANIDQYIAQNQNKSTVKKTFYNIKQLKLFTDGNGDTRPIESIPKSELCDILCTYFIQLKKSDGNDFLQFQERQSKTCQEDNPVSVCDVHPKSWATNDARCPVALYKLYATLRPSDYSTSNSPFYLATNTKMSMV